jgi:hypothetical protein
MDGWMENKRSVDFQGFGQGDAGGPIDRRVDGLCSHVCFTDVAAPSGYVCFTDVAAPSGCWRLFEEKNMPIFAVSERGGGDR